VGRARISSRLQFGRGAQHGEKALLALSPVVGLEPYGFESGKSRKMVRPGISGSMTKKRPCDPGLSHGTLFRADLPRVLPSLLQALMDSAMPHLAG
jgi:hypothetical protein